MRLHARSSNSGVPGTTTTTMNTNTNNNSNNINRITKINKNNNNNLSNKQNPGTTAASTTGNQQTTMKPTISTFIKIKTKSNGTIRKPNSLVTTSPTKKSSNSINGPAAAAATSSTTTTTTQNKDELISKTSGEEVVAGEVGEDIETTAVELRSTSLHYRGAYNTLRSNSASAIIAGNGHCCYPLIGGSSCGVCGNNSTTTTTTTTVYVRPRTLNVNNARQTPAQQTQMFFGEVLNAWRAKARCNVVPDERTQELFHELSFHPSQKQISEMLQTAKKVARKGSSQPNGLTFGQFCVLAADLKRFRASTFSNTTNFSHQVSGSLQQQQQQNAEDNNLNDNAKTNNSSSTSTSTSTSRAHNNKLENYGTELRSTKSFSSVDDTKKKNKHSEPVEVFLGGSCNPTTWRADVAIPALKELGISFYNPQVSNWTPDLIELEHHAKEKARVLFFVMDSETRASAAAIEVAHIAGQNCKQLVLVMHPYKPNQSILNESLSEQEFIDLRRNQMMLKELVTRRGLPVMDNISSGLQRTKEIFSGYSRDPPSKISSILDVVRGAFDRVNPINESLTVQQCQRALSFLGYAQSLLNLDNLNKIIINQRESLKLLQISTNKAAVLADDASTGATTSSSSTTPTSSSSSACKPSTKDMAQADGIDFDLFCVISAYLSVLQQEIHESGCISPIKGTNVPPPPVYFTNAHDDDIYFSAVKNISRTSSNASVPSNSSSGTGSGTDLNERQNLFELLSRSRDSGTSSPQPQVEPIKMTLATSSSGGSSGRIIRCPSLLGKLKQQNQPQILLNVESIETTEIITTKTIETNVNAAGKVQPSGGVSGATSTNDEATISTATATAKTTPEYLTLNSTEEESDDSNDSVFSSSSSIASVTGNPFVVDPLCFNNLEIRDVYLGGSCVLRTKWRQEVAIPYFKEKTITYNMPSLHESIQQNFGAKSCESTKSSADDGSLTNAHSNGMDKVHEEQQRSFVRTKRKCRGTQLQLEEEEELTVAEESWSWSLPPMGVRPNLYNPSLLESSRVLLFVITNETRSLAPMTLAAHCIGLMYNVVLAVQMLPEGCVLGNENLTPAAIKDYNRGRAYLVDLAKRQGVPVFNDIQAALECTMTKIKTYNNRNQFN